MGKCHITYCIDLVINWWNEGCLAIYTVTGMTQESHFGRRLFDLDSSDAPLMTSPILDSPWTRFPEPVSETPSPRCSCCPEWVRLLHVSELTRVCRKEWMLEMSPARKVPQLSEQLSFRTLEAWTKSTRESTASSVFSTNTVEGRVLSESTTNPAQRRVLGSGPELQLFRLAHQGQLTGERSAQVSFRVSFTPQTQGTKKKTARLGNDKTDADLPLSGQGWAFHTPKPLPPAGLHLLGAKS